ncbi:MAG: DUF6644 family protein [Vicinamibacterales bacterium]
MAAFVTWLRDTPVSQAFRVPLEWLWPVCESFHFLGLALVIGTAAFFDARLLGFMKRIPITKAAEFLPLAKVGLAINLTTGLYFYIASPFQYSFNIAWWYKVAAIAIGVTNAVFFEMMLKSRAASLRDDEDVPLSFKIVGTLSMLAWLNVVYWGRMLPFWSPPGGGADL